MSDQGFHEVQLSGKQLVCLFMSAVVVMVVVFLLGGTVGRGVRSAVGEPEVLAQGDPAAPKGPDAAPAATESAKPTPELSYHDLLLQATPAPDKAAADKTPPAEAPPPVAEAPPPTQNPTPVPAPNPPAEKVTPAPPAAAAPKPSGSEWFLQTGAYSTQAVADGQVAKLKQLNFPAFVLSTERNGNRLFNVRVGPFADRAEADRAGSRLKRQGYSSLITR